MALATGDIHIVSVIAQVPFVGLGILRLLLQPGHGHAFLAVEPCASAGSLQDFYACDGEAEQVPPHREVRGGPGHGDSFRPSAWASEPYVVVSGTVAVAGTLEEARRILLPEAWSMAYARTRGSFPPLSPAERVESLAMSAKERGFYEAGLVGHIAATEEQVAGELESLIEETGAQEVLVTTSTYDRPALLDSYRRLARVAGLGTAQGPARERQRPRSLSPG